MSLLIRNLFIVSILAGQLVKLPIGQNSGATLLDFGVGGLCFWVLIKSGFKLTKPPVFILSGLVFVAVCLVSLLLSPLHLTSFEKITSFFYTLRFFLYLLLGWLVYQKVLLIDFKNLTEIFIKSGVGLAILGLIQLIFLPNLEFLEAAGWDPHFFRTTSTFLDPNFLGAYLVLTLLTLFHLRAEDRDKSYVHLGGVILVYLALLTTFSRGAYLAFLMSFLTLSFLKKSTKLALVTLVLFGCLMLGFFTYQDLVATPRGIDRQKSASFRLNTWQQGWEIFQKDPILGVGFNTYRFALKEYNLADDKFLSSHGATSNDSSLLFVLATTGVVGFLSYLFFLVQIGILGFKKNPILLAGLLGLLTQSFFANTLFYPPLLLWLILWTREDLNL